jgi:serine-type D-Ala-D-Ala carboxypeptidase (penicillin-binding protein 5/6)
VIDADSGAVLYDKDSTTSRAPASLTKIFTAAVAIELTPPDFPMQVTEADVIGEASMGLGGYERLPFETLLHGLLLPSGNDAAMAIARNLGEASGYEPSIAVTAFVEHANNRVRELGLRGTRLMNPHGLDQEGHYSTAYDIAAMTRWALDAEPEFMAAAGSTYFEGNGFTLYQTNDLHYSYPGLLVGKTGVTDDAGFCLMEAAQRDGRRVIA